MRPDIWLAVDLPGRPLVTSLGVCRTLSSTYDIMMKISPFSKRGIKGDFAYESGRFID